jgi:hypothetical protein
MLMNGKKTSLESGGYVLAEKKKFTQTQSKKQLCGGGKLMLVFVELN